jgi:molecular chaperone HscB
MFDFSRNHFELFGLSVGFVIDAEELAQRYRELQKVVHPDRFAAADELSQRLSMQLATQVNEAYKTLREPLRRARYMLELYGIDIDEHQAGFADAEFLAEQMALREALAGVRSAAAPQAELDRLLDEIAIMLREQVAQLAVLFESPSAEGLEAAAHCATRMQFLDRLHAEAEALEADLDEVS